MVHSGDCGGDVRFSGTPIDMSCDILVLIHAIYKHILEADPKQAKTFKNAMIRDVKNAFFESKSELEENLNNSLKEEEETQKTLKDLADVLPKMLDAVIKDDNISEKEAMKIGEVLTKMVEGIWN